jgi:DNA 3'-phosphatase
MNWVIYDNSLYIYKPEQSINPQTDLSQGSINPQTDLSQGSINPQTDLSQGSVKIAGFDYDDTLVPRKNTNGTTSDLLLEKLIQLHKDNYLLVIFTNESLERYTKSSDKVLSKKLRKLEELIVQLKEHNCPIEIYVATKKDSYRKPDTGAFKVFSEGLVIDSNSFYVGDAGGSRGDYSDTDIKFAENNSLKFIHIRDFNILK